jgi:CRP-like cAMP-binding protein
MVKNSIVLTIMSTELLRRCPLFAGLKEEELTKIKSIASLKKVGKKEIIFSDGEEAKGFYAIFSGKVKIYKVSPEGKEQILHVVSAPDAFAEAALFLEVELDLSKTQLASKLGTISETLSRTLAKMKAKGIIDVKKIKFSSSTVKL